MIVSNFSKFFPKFYTDKTYMQVYINTWGPLLVGQEALPPNLKT